MGVPASLCLLTSPIVLVIIKTKTAAIIDIYIIIIYNMTSLHAIAIRGQCSV